MKRIASFTRLCAIPLAGLALIIAASLYLYLSPSLPSVEALKTVRLQTPLRIYSQDFKLIGEFGEKRRTPLDFEAIPLAFIQAVLAAEDDAFYQHIGVDFKGLLRAALELLTTGSIQTGGSTITMQLARNFFLTREQSFIRKFNEILLALRIEDELDKDKIFTLYANKIYLGNRAYGIGAAALTYYGKPVGELSLSELAMMAGLPKAPSSFNPIINPTRALTRRNWILGRMLKLGYINTKQYQQAHNSPVSALYHGPKIDYNAPYAAEEARRFAVTKLGTEAYTGGYRVITTINSQLQQFADQALRKGLMAYDWRHGYRGPEAHITDPDQWQSTLATTPVIGTLPPAIITSVSEDSLSLMTSFEPDIVLTKQHHKLSQLRLFISANRRGTAIKTLSELFSPGDLVRLAYDAKARPRLSQLPRAQSALISISPENGAIRAITGGFDYYQSHFNRANQAKRQPGSNFKPFIYTAALEYGMTAASIINDAPVVFDSNAIERSWRPENSSGQFYGPTRLREALYRSRNLVSIRILRKIGVKTALNTIEKFGFNKSSLPQDLSLALGSHALTPREIATGYASFANGGFKVSAYLIEQIKRTDGTIVYQAEQPVVCANCDSSPETVLSNSTACTQVFDPSSIAPSPVADADHADDAIDPLLPETAESPQTDNGAELAVIEDRPPAERIIDPRIAYLIDSMLKDVILRGTGTRARVLNRADIGGKTGTTNGPRDAWFSGYNPDLVTTVWLGFDNNALLGAREFGGSAALPIWIDYMAAALADKEEKLLPRPQGLVSVKIDPDTGLRATTATSKPIFEIFRQENIPAIVSSLAASPIDGTSSGSLPEDIF